MEDETVVETNGFALKEVLSLILVGAFWGCTNPVLRRGSTKASVKEEVDLTNDSRSLTERLFKTLRKFRNIRVWLPYTLNQCGSLVYYMLLASSDLSTAVPICNSLALVFSFVTSYALGEEVDKPMRAVSGAILVVIGVSICMLSRDMDSVLSIIPNRTPQQGHGT